MAAGARPGPAPPPQRGRPAGVRQRAPGVVDCDLAQAPRTALKAQLCGDAHRAACDTFAGPDRRLVFGINDFDETLPGPFEWDVKRLVASFEVAGRDRGFDGVARRSV